jgi:RNA polymerase sigma-70 factor, ECF subfamily
MTEYPETRDSLLVQVGDPQNAEAWEQFARIYRPVIFRLARRRGLQDADAHDLSQQVLMSVASSIEHWERNDESVRFRHWLRRVTRNAIVNALSRSPRDRAVGGSSVQELLDREPDLADASASDTDREFEIEYRRELYLRAADIVRVDIQPDTWRAFELTVIDGQSIELAASQLSKSIGTIYAARSRVMRRLREAVRELEDMES